MLPPKDVEFLYKSIENYQQIMTILVLVATWKYATGSNEALGSLSDFVDSITKA
jgi:hypothetical protein